MSWTASDRRLWRLVKLVILAVEDPAKGILFDDFDRRYREKEWKRENDAAHWFYRDKTSFETKYAEDCGDDPCNEPAWVTDGGRGKAALEGVVSYDLDGEEDREDAPARRGGRTSTWAMRWEAALKRVKRNLPHALQTLKLIIRNHNNRKESICSLVKSKASSRRNGNSRGGSTIATSATSSASSDAVRR